MQVFVSVILWVLMGAIASYFANQRGRDPTTWFFLGAFLGLIGVICLFILPDLKKASKEKIKTEHLDPFKEVPPSIRFKQWFYLDEQRQQRGPFSFEGMLSAWKEHQFFKQSFVWSEGMEEWKKVDQLPELLEQLETEF